MLTLFVVTVNITFDPSVGKGPYNVIVAYANFFPVQFQSKSFRLSPCGLLDD